MYTSPQLVFSPSTFPSPCSYSPIKAPKLIQTSSLSSPFYFPCIPTSLSSILIKFYISYLFNNPVPPPTITPQQLNIFSLAPTPCLWTNLELLVRGLRTPYIICDHPLHLPNDALRWSFHQNPITLPHFGTCTTSQPVNIL